MSLCFFFNDTATTEIYSLSLHDALPIWCFTENAVVKDEGHIHNGRAAIKQWKTDASVKYDYTSELLACEQKGGKTVVTSRLTGNFPGSPVDLRYFFKLEGDKVTSLEITP